MLCALFEPSYVLFAFLLLFDDVFLVVRFSMLELSLLCALFEPSYVLFAFLLLFYDVFLVVQFSMLGL